MAQFDAVSLTDMLLAREMRAKRQDDFFKQHNSTLLSYSLNVVGAQKRSDLLDRAFYEGLAEIKTRIIQHRLPVKESVKTDATTGLEYLWAIDADAVLLKSIFVQLEETHPLGRLFDMDVLCFQRGKIERSMLNRAERSCLLCNEAGHACARSRKHEVSEVIAYIENMLDVFFVKKDAQLISQIAVGALLYELSVTPKPGLVDRKNNGAHMDMDFYTFLDSATALSPYFEKMYVLGAENKNLSAKELLPHLRVAGIRAESDMFSATAGINTHKGAIFSLGILAASCGYLGAGNKDVQQILETAAHIASGALKTDFAKLEQENATTNGEVLFVKHGITGIRGEAALGFPAVRKYGLKTLEEAMLRGVSLNDAGVETLLTLLSCVEDTNIIHRGGRQRLKEIQDKLQQFLKTQPNTEEILQYATHLDRQFISENLSPGGCADLLAICYMLHLLKRRSG